MNSQGGVFESKADKFACKFVICSRDRGQEFCAKCRESHRNWCVLNTLAARPTSEVPHDVVQDGTSSILEVDRV